MQEGEKQQITHEGRRRESLRSLMTGFVIPAVMTFTFLKIVFSLFFIPSSSMEPTLHKNSFCIGWRLPYFFADPMPERGDIVVFRSNGSHELLVKRVIAIGGDVVVISDGDIYLNGDVLDEPYLLDGMITEGEYEFRVPDGKIFLLGDNRCASLDSRYWQVPYVDIESVVAKVLCS